MPRAKKKAELAATVREFTPDTFDQSTPVTDQPDTSFDVAALDRQQTAAEVVQGFADATRLPDDAPTPTHAERVTRREPVVTNAGLTFHKTDVLAGVRQGEGFRLIDVTNDQGEEVKVKVKDAVLAFEEKPTAAVIAAVRDAGFRWQAVDKVWTRSIRKDTAWQDRAEADKAFAAVSAIIRAERGITHEFGG